MTVLRKIAHVFWRSVSETVFVWLHEASNAVRDDAVWVFILLVPIGYPLLYSYIYNNEVVRDIPVAVVDMDNSPESRDYIRKLDASENALVQTRPADLATAQEEMREQKVYGIVYIPADFSRNISTMQSATVYLFSDVTTLIYYRQLAIANTGVSFAMNAKIKAIRGGGTTARQDELVQSPIKYEQVDIFNPQLGIATFLLPAVLMLILQQTMFLGIGITAGTMREKNGFRLYAPVARHAGGTFEIVLGRSLCYLPIYVANSFWVLGITPMIFHFERLSRFPSASPTSSRHARAA